MGGMVIRGIDGQLMEVFIGVKGRRKRKGKKFMKNGKQEKWPHGLAYSTRL